MWGEDPYHSDEDGDCEDSAEDENDSGYFGQAPDQNASSVFGQAPGDLAQEDEYSEDDASSPLESSPMTSPWSLHPQQQQPRRKRRRGSSLRRASSSSRHHHHHHRRGRGSCCCSAMLSYAWAGFRALGVLSAIVAMASVGLMWYTYSVNRYAVARSACVTTMEEHRKMLAEVCPNVDYENSPGTWKDCKRIQERITTEGYTIDSCAQERWLHDWGPVFAVTYAYERAREHWFPILIAMGVAGTTLWVIARFLNFVMPSSPTMTSRTPPPTTMEAAMAAAAAAHMARGAPFYPPAFTHANSWPSFPSPWGTPVTTAAMRQPQMSPGLAFGGAGNGGPGEAYGSGQGSQPRITYVE